MKQIMSKKRFVELLDELTCETCKSNYCFAKIFLESLHPDPSILIQLKCIEKFKWEESERQGREVDWNEAAMLWANNGWAKAFRIVVDNHVNENHTISEIYLMTMQELHTSSR